MTLEHAVQVLLPALRKDMEHLPLPATAEGALHQFRVSAKWLMSVGLPNIAQLHSKVCTSTSSWRVLTLRGSNKWYPVAEISTMPFQLHRGPTWVRHSRRSQAQERVCMQAVSREGIC